MHVAPQSMPLGLLETDPEPTIDTLSVVAVATVTVSSGPVSPPTRSDVPAGFRYSQVPGPGTVNVGAARAVIVAVSSTVRVPGVLFWMK